MPKFDPSHFEVSLCLRLEYMYWKPVLGCSVDQWKSKHFLRVLMFNISVDWPKNVTFFVLANITYTYY